ncbi:MAG: ring-cleaving dioxygenase [Saprospiraceae bacterium]
METNKMIKGIHHVTATVNDAQEDYDFYTKLLGQRLVKKTVNFDNNQVYHFYYGNEQGTPGTIMTTFPYKGHQVREGLVGTGQVSITAFSVPLNAIPFWQARLTAANVPVVTTNKFGLPTLQFADPSDLPLEIVGNEEDDREPWTTKEVDASVAIRGFFNVTLAIAEVNATFAFIMKEFGFTEVGKEGLLTRFAAEGGGAGQYLDILSAPTAEKGINGIGTVHHVAWRIEHDENLLAMRRHLTDNLGFNVTEVKDRNYFHSIYFRIPGGVLFEIATIPPGFAIDETLENLGTHLKLPSWEEVNRLQIEKVLAKVRY